ncbi:MAG: hypothetical protein IKW00_08790 [Clostridia bacterium]|nr:hypothetical protein [Clostridia bacterium]
MTKRLVSLALILVLMLCLLPAAQAAEHPVQDPASFFGDLLSDHDESNLVTVVDRKGVKIASIHSFKYYAEEDSDAFARMVAAYEDYLVRHAGLKRSGSEINKGGWVYRWYTLENATDKDLFKSSNTTPTGEWKKFTASIEIMYSPEYSEISFYYALSFNLTDLNYRLDEKEHAALSVIAAEYAQKRAKEEAARKAEEEKAAQAAAAQSQSSGGSSSFSWSSSSSSSSINRTKRCTFCGGDGKVSCSNCSGRGYKEKTVSTPNYSGKGPKYETVKENCYRCHGSGTVDCGNCGGDGKVEY